jgi:hypothetical protein
MVEDWTWKLELVPQLRGWYRAKIKVYTDCPPRMPGLSFRFKQGRRLWDWLESNWEEITQEPLDHYDGLEIAGNLAAIDQAAGIDLKEAVMRSWICKALEDHECLPERPSRLDLILSRTRWLDPLPQGGGGLVSGMARGLRMTAVAQFVRNHLANGESSPTGDLHLKMTFGPAGSGMDFVPPSYVAAAELLKGDSESSRMLSRMPMAKSAASGSARIRQSSACRPPRGHGCRVTRLKGVTTA